MSDMLQAATVSQNKKSTRKPAKAEPMTLADVVKRAQQEAIMNALRATEYSPTQAAVILGVQGGAGNLIRLMKRLEIYDSYQLERLDHLRSAIKPGSKD